MTGARRACACLNRSLRLAGGVEKLRAARGERRVGLVLLLASLLGFGRPMTAGLMTT